MKKLLKKKMRAFTLLEMICVIAIMAALILLFAPKLMSQKDAAITKNNEAVVKVINEQFELAKLEEKNSSLGTIASNGYLTDAQLKALKEEGYINEKQEQTYQKIRK